MRATRRLLLAAAGSLAAPALRAQPAWPSRPIRIIVPFGLGGAADVAARFIADPLSQALGQPVVIENRPGAGGTIGTDMAAKAAPDGHTLVALGNTASANEVLIPHRGYVLLRDLTAVAPISIANNALAVHPGVPAATLPEFLALLKREPGRWNYAHSGTGTPYHLAGDLLMALAGVDLVGVSFRGSKEARTALLGGQVPVMFDGIPTIAPQIAAGRVRGLATTGAVRDPALPELPAVAEVLPGFEYPIWIGLMMPAATPTPIVERLHAAVTAIVDAPSGRAAIRRMGAQPMVMTLAGYDAYLKRDGATLAKLLHDANIRPD